MYRAVNSIQLSLAASVYHRLDLGFFEPVLLQHLIPCFLGLERVFTHNFVHNSLEHGRGVLPVRPISHRQGDFVPQKRIVGGIVEDRLLKWLRQSIFQRLDRTTTV